MNGWDWFNVFVVVAEVVVIWWLLCRYEEQVLGAITKIVKKITKDDTPMTPNHNPHVVPGVDLDALEAKAKNATKGPWSTERVKVVKAEGKNVVVLPEGADKYEGWILEAPGDKAAAFFCVEGGADMAHIAACDPDTVLELIRRLRNLEEWAEADPEGETDTAELQANWHGYNTAQSEVLNILAGGSALGEPASPSPVEGPAE